MMSGTGRRSRNTGPDSFAAGMGAESIRELLRKVR